MGLLSACHRSFFLMLSLGAVSVAYAQAIPAEQWTQQEQQFVKNARALYEQQGIAYGDEQAAAAVQQLRAKQQAQSAPVLKGIPESEWTAQERVFIQELRAQYQQQNRSLSQEEAQVAVQGMRNQMARLMGTMGAMRGMPSMAAAAPAAPNTAGTASATMTEPQIAAAMANCPAKPQSFVLVERKDGFELNGQVIVDPEGRITSVASDAVSGAITYVVQGSQGVTIKAMCAGDSRRTLVIATGQQTANGWELRTSAGQNLAGPTVAVLSDGFLVGRDTAAFRYKSGEGVTNIAIPTGWALTPLQRGDLGSTDHVLLEKDGATGNDSATRLMSSLQSIGSMLGATRKEDYALFSIKTRKLLPLNIAANGKTINVHSQCRKRNKFVNECAQMQSFESLYQRDGSRHNTHYYWSIHWMNTPSGPVALTLEDGMGRLFLTDLQSGKKVVVLERSLGIADWDVLAHPDGRIGVKGRLAFETREVSDVLSLLQAPTEQSPQRSEASAQIPATSP